jgi:O-antigen/teichoic acid export membrane protein
MIAPSYMLNLFYGGHSSYLPLQNTLRVVAFAYVYVYTAIVLGNVLNALGRPRIPFNGLLAGFTVSVTLGLPLAAVAGVPGAAAAVLFDGAARCVPQAFALRRVMRECPR